MKFTTRTVHCLVKEASQKVRQLSEDLTMVSSHEGQSTTAAHKRGSKSVISVYRYFCCGSENTIYHLANKHWIVSIDHDGEALSVNPACFFCEPIGLICIRLADHNGCEQANSWWHLR